jgi:hypothetical protein
MADSHSEEHGISAPAQDGNDYRVDYDMHEVDQISPCKGVSYDSVSDTSILRPFDPTSHLSVAHSVTSVNETIGPPFATEDLSGTWRPDAVNLLHVPAPNLLPVSDVASGGASLNTSFAGFGATPFIS